MFNFIKTHKMSLLSFLLVAAAAVLGADSAFAMAVDPVEPQVEQDNNPQAPAADNANPSIDINDRPKSEQPNKDLAGLNTVQKGPANATDVRDAGLEAEDFDKDVVFFNKFKYVSETMLAVKVKGVKVNSYVVDHFRLGQPNLDAVYNGASAITIEPGKKTLIISNAYDVFENPDVLNPCVPFIIEGVTGYAKDAGDNEFESGNLQLLVTEVNGETVKFHVTNGSKDNAIVIPVNTKFIQCALAGSESQMNGTPVTFLPERRGVVLQKKIETCRMTDDFKEQIKKSPITKADVIKYTTDIFKRKCARSHWLGEGDRVDVKVKELNNSREASYIEQGILRQIPGLYTHGAEMTDEDFMAITSMMFTEYAQSDSATAFVGKYEMLRIMRHINKSERMRDASKVEINEYGIKVRKWVDNFGSIEFIYDQTLDELGFGEFMVILDFSSMVRYYKRDEKVQTRDMKKTAEAREAEEWNISRIDCYCLRGGNALIVCPKDYATKASGLGSIKYHFESLKEGMSLNTADKSKVWYLEIDQPTEGMKAGVLVEYEPVNGWQQWQGRVID